MVSIINVIILQNRGLNLTIMEQSNVMEHQYHNIKGKHPDYLLIFRNEDFWELYANDATVASRVLNIPVSEQVCGQGKKIWTVRFPCHELDTHLPKLIRFGSRVALCEQSKPAVQV